jgi:glycine betaine/proline transport system permease protein
VVEHFRPFFQAIRLPIDATLTGIEQALLAVPAFVMCAQHGRTPAGVSPAVS